MDVRVHGRNFHVADGLRATTERKVGRAVKVFDHVDVADVEFSREENPRNAAGRHRCEITAKAAGSVVRAEAEADTAGAALDKAVDRFGANLRKVGSRLQDRHKRGSKKPLNVTSHSAEIDEADELEIVRVKQFIMKPMTPEDAALEMDHLGHSFFFFLNADTSRESVLYRRNDGRLGLIEPA